MTFPSRKSPFRKFPFRTFGILAVAAALLAAPLALATPSPARADGGSVGGSVAGSAHIVHGSLTVAGQASAQILTGASALVVWSVTTSAQGARIVVESVADGSRHVLVFTGQGLARASDWVGRTIRVAATASGTLITAGAEVLAFIPNAAAAALFIDRPYGPPVYGDQPRSGLR